MISISRIVQATRLRLVRPAVRARGVLLRKLQPKRAPRTVEELDRVPILVLGCHRSGTSLLRRCLNAHSRISCPAETLFLESLAAALDYPHAEDGFAAIGIDRARAAADLRALVERWMREHARSVGKPRWADKSPGVLGHLDGLDRLFGENVRYVAIVRNGMDVATSLGGAEPRWWQLADHAPPDDDPYVAAAAYWAARSEALAEFVERHRDQVHLIRYEELVEHPEATLRGVFASLGEAWEPEILDFNRHAHSRGLEDHHVSTTTGFEDRRGKHRGLPEELQERMRAAMRSELGRWGYGESPS